MRQSRKALEPAAAFAAAWGICLLATVAAARDGAQTTRGVAVNRNILLITVDTLRADALGFAGNKEVATPTLDRLAAAGRVYTSAHAHCVTTLPSHASILTGLYPFQHGVRHNSGFTLEPDVPTAATLLKESGFATAAFVGAFPLDSSFGLNRGFETYDDDYYYKKQYTDLGRGGGTGDSMFLYSERSGSEVVERGLSWWQAHRDRQRFLWLHLFDPHTPYAPPEPYETRFAESPYLGEVSAVDGFLSPLLEGFLTGEEEPTLIVFTSDHGEGLGDHGEPTHGLFAYESTLKVPLVLWGAGVDPGVDPRPARHVDLLPTLFAAIGEELPGRRWPGRSLLGPADHHPDESFFEALSGHLDFGWAPLRGILKGGMKFIDLPVPELYDLQQDARELQNLFAQQRRTASDLARRLPGESVWPPEAGDISPEVAARLRSLGYLSGGATKKVQYTAADDPKNLVALERKVARMAELSEQGQLSEAIALGREILAQRPSMGLVYVYLSTLLVKAGDPGEAIRVMRRAQSEDLSSPELERQLGLTLVNAGRPREALEVLEPLAKNPTDTEARNHLALALAYLGRHEEASSMLRKLVAAEPRQALAFENLSFVAIQSGRFEEARDSARGALVIDPRRVSSWNNLGIALFNLGSSAEAIDAWKRALDLAPDDTDSLLNLGLVEAQRGNRDAAREALSRFLEVASSPANAAKRRQAADLLKQLGPKG